MRWRIAISCARRILVIVSGHHDPALTVASFATTTTSRPPTLPTHGDHACGWRFAVVPVVGDEQPDLEPWRAGIEQRAATRSRGASCPLRVHLLDALGAAALARAWAASARYSSVSAQRTRCGSGLVIASVAQVVRAPSLWTYAIRSAGRVPGPNS